MKRTLSQPIFRLTAAIAALASAAVAQASTAVVPDLSPGWANASDVTESPNCSFLSNLEYTDEENPLNQLMEAHTVLEMRQQYQDLNRDYDRRQSYGLTTREEDETHLTQLQGFGRDAFGRVRSYQINKEANQMKSNVEREPGLRTLVKPAAIIGMGAAIYTGTPIDVRVNDETRLRARADGRKQTGEFRLFSPIVNGGVEMSMATPATRDPSVPIDPSVQDERYRVSLSRGLPILDLSSGVSYGSTTSTMSASLSKQLTQNLSAVVDSSRPLDPVRAANLPIGGESVRLLYGVRF